MLASVPQIRTSTTGIAPSVGFTNSSRSMPWSNNVRRFRRPARGSETSAKFVERAIPEGMQRPDHTREALEALRSHPEFDVIRSDRKNALVRCVEALISLADFSTMTTKPTWAKLTEMLGVTRRTVARYLQHLKSMGILGVVASGRSARYAAKGPDGLRSNEAAVYVLCVPKKTRSTKALFTRFLGSNSRAVDESVTPPSEAGLYLSNKEVNPRTRARKGFSQSKEQKRLGCSVEQIRWNKHWKVTGRRQQLTAAWRLKMILFNVLGRMTNRDVASCVRPFFEAGWSVADVHHALDHRHDGTPWPHSGAPDTKAPHRVRGWLTYRLNAWKDDEGHPLPSKNQVANEQLDQQRRQRQFELEQQSARGQKVQAVDESVKRHALEQMRTMLERGKAKRLLHV